jgi:hypothetical protein
MPIVNEAACRRLDLAGASQKRQISGVRGTESPDSNLKAPLEPFRSRATSSSEVTDTVWFQVGQAWSLSVESAARAFGITYSRGLPQLGRKA